MIPIHTELLEKLTHKQRAFVLEYIKTGNASYAAREAGYSPASATAIGSENLSKPDIKAAIDAYWQAKAITADQIIGRNSDIATFDITLYLNDEGDLDVKALRADGYGHLIKGVKKNLHFDKDGELVEMTVDYSIKDGQRALEFGAKILGLDKSEENKQSVTVKIIGGFDPDKV